MKKLRSHIYAGVILLILSGVALAEVGPEHKGTFASYLFSDTSSGKPLAFAGYAPGPLLVSERLPSGDYLQEWEVSPTKGRARLRVPIRTSKNVATWTPSAAYTQALVNLTNSGSLPKGSGDGEWADVERLPALSLIVTKKRIITPMGEADPSKLADAEGGDLKIIKELVPLIQRWLNDVAQGDPALAGVDLIVDGKLTWLELNHVIFTFSTLGLFDVQLVLQGEGGRLNALRVVPPVSSFSKEAPPLVVVMYPQGDSAFGFRVAQNGKLLTSETPCAPEMSFCAASAADFKAALKDAPKPSVSLFAASSKTSVAQALPYLEQTRALAGAEHRATVVGYVQQ